jgi:hypothetical protein
VPAAKRIVARAERQCSVDDERSLMPNSECGVPDDRQLLGRQLYDSERERLSRLFSDGEEHMATVFSWMLAEGTGIGCGRPGIGGWGAPEALTCVG